MKTAITLLVFLSGCASAPQRPPEQRFARQSWAIVSAAQAEAECYAEINRLGGIPSLYLCMRAKGWNER